MNTVLVILAHPDDEAYGPCGTIRKLSSQAQVHAMILCSGKRPGAEHVSDLRRRICEMNLTQLGVSTTTWCNYDDTKLEFTDALHAIENIVKQTQPTIVLTHDCSDLHRDHRIVHEATLVACRPTPLCSVESLYTFEVPGATDWAFGQFGQFTPNTYIDITQYIDMKCMMLSQYTTETYDYPDSRSVESVQVTAASRGKVMGMAYAEAFRLVYARGRTI